MTGSTHRSREQPFGAAAVLTVAFAVVLGVLAALRPASTAQQQAADPLVQLLGGAAPWLVVGAALAAAIGWWSQARITRRDLLWALAGAAAAVAIGLAVHAIVGDRLPSFVPSEESGRPGLTLSLAAGLVEEVAFRLALLPVLIILLGRRLDARIAAVLAVVVTGALFALSHELGPAGGHFIPRFMLTRFVIPGVVMSVVALRVNMTFLVFAHCTAHLIIPSLFPG